MRTLRDLASGFGAVFTVAILFGLGTASTTQAQWDPTNGDWGKTDPDHVRVMTWNIQDGICSTAWKAEQRNSWTALARIVAAMKPDVLIMQEVGDNSGNGTGSGVDSVGNLETTLELFMHGGADPFEGGTVTAFVQSYAPSYDLPYIFVSPESDGFNRNVIMSRFPFGDLNGDGIDQKNDIDVVFADGYAPGGDGGIRGFQFAEIDLPDTMYPGDLVVGNAHLKSGFGSSDLAQRLEASKNVAYWIDHLLNGAGTGSPDPNGKVRDIPAVTNILDDDTPVIFGGDWNEDEATNGRKGPAEWLTRAQSTGGTDGTDRDRTDSLFDDARDVFTNDNDTLGNSKLDYIAWQDSIATLRLAWIFDSSTITGSGMPIEIQGLLGGPVPASNIAADHLPVVADFAIPTPKVTAAFDPDSLVAQVGGELFFDASITSHVATSESGDAWIDVFDPDGTPFFASNPKFGPKAWNLNPFQTKQKSNIRLNILAGKTPGPGYKVRAYIGTYPSAVTHVAEFEFELTP